MSGRSHPRIRYLQQNEHLGFPSFSVHSVQLRELWRGFSTECAGWHIRAWVRFGYEHKAGIPAEVKQARKPKRRARRSVIIGTPNHAHTNFLALALWIFFTKPFKTKTVIAKRNGSERRLLRNALFPLVGFAFCGLIWWNLNNLERLWGAYGSRSAFCMSVTKRKAALVTPVRRPYKASFAT